MDSSRKNIVHLIAGGVGGTVGAVATCPLEVLKTRLQSSVSTFHPPSFAQPCHHFPAMTANLSTSHGTFTTPVQLMHQSSRRPLSLGIYLCLRHIVETEGVRGLFKGLGPNVVGVAPSRAIYFCTYARSKRMLNEVMPRDSPIVHIISAMAAGFTASTLTNPIWFVKTRLQLDQKRDGSLTCRECVKRLYAEKGLRGFYKGITASYFGITETVIHFVIYEAVKEHLRQFSNQQHSSAMSPNLLRFMLAGAISKTCATCIAYPHEVARTRLRQEGNKYRTFVQTLSTVFREEGFRALYSGLCTQLVRQIPNTALMMATYEAVVHLLSQYE